MRKKFITAGISILLAGLSIHAQNPEQYFNGIKLTTGYKSQSNHNPLFTQRFGADPCAMVYNDEVYIYMTNDVLEYDSNGNLIENTYAKINTINCVSSKDMVNWTDHGTMEVAGRNNNKYPAKWATCSWAPTACHKTIDGKEKFFLYFANNGSGIGVVTSDSPWGPWVDPIGKELVSRSTPNCNNVTWLFDPAVLVDDDGTGYIYFGGGVPNGKEANPGTARVAKLGKDFISISGTPATINPPYLFEDAGINKIGNTYAYSYCINWNTGGNNLGISNAQIGYMTSSSPMGPFTFKGVAYENQGSFLSGQNGGNNHHSMFKFKDRWYMTYHARLLQNAMNICPGKNLNYRSTHVDYVTVNESTGAITKSKGSEKGVSQVGSLNPFERTEAETMAWMGGIDTKYGGSNMIVTKIDKGDWIGLEGVDFGAGASVFTANVSSTTGNVAIQIRRDALDGNVIGYLEVPNTGGALKEVSARLTAPVSSKHNLYFIFSGSMEFDYWQFKTADITLDASETELKAPASLTLTAKSTESNIAKINFLQNGVVIGSVDKAPYTLEVKDLEGGVYKFTAEMVSNTGKEDKSGEVTVVVQGPYTNNNIPGTIEVENYDLGGEGYAYHDEESNYNSEVCDFRSDEGVDLDNGNDGYVLGWTIKGEWLEYTVNVEYDDTYKWTANVASGLEGSSFKLYIDDKAITDVIEVPMTEKDSWSKYATIEGTTSKISKGEHILKLSIESSYCNIDYITFEAVNHESVGLSENIKQSFDGNYQVYTAQGLAIGSIQVSGNALKEALNSLNLDAGVYILQSDDNKVSKVVLTKE